MFGYSEGPEGEVIVFEGKTDGVIVSPRGKRDFGWDPIFQPNGFDLTYAELDSTVKNSISHRGKSLEKLKEYFNSDIVGNENGVTDVNGATTAKVPKRD